MKSIFTILLLVLFLQSLQLNDIPKHIYIENIVDMPVVEMGSKVLPDGNNIVLVDDYYPTWFSGSAKLGEGNTVIAGHNYSAFQLLHNIEIGDTIKVNNYKFTVTHIFIVNEVHYEDRVKNSRYLLPTENSRLTLITCLDGKTKRIIVIAE